MNSLKDQVVVITGASSGNGKAAALEFAKEGAKVVLASRNLEVLNSLAEACKNRGAEAIALEVDVTDAAAVDALAKKAFDQFGRIDVWINNAGVGCVGKLNDAPIEAHTRVIQTNLLGAVHGAYAVLPYFKNQKQGVLINTNSSGAWIPLPYACAYSASKFGLRGFMEALRAELSDEPNIHVCEVFPAFVSTPGIQHAGNYVGKELGNPALAGDPVTVAKRMVSLAKHPKDRATMMMLTNLGRAGYFLFPKLVRRLTAKFMAGYFNRAKSVEKTSGNLFHAARKHFGVHAEPKT